MITPQVVWFPLFFVFVFGVINAAETPLSLEGLEKKIEEKLVTEPNAKSFAGLLATFEGNGDAMSLVSGLDIPRLHELSSKGRYHGVVFLAFAQRQKSGSLTEQDAISLSLEAISHLTDEQIMFGEANPVFFYWQFFDQWPTFIKMLPNLKKYLVGDSVISLVFNKVSDDDLLLINHSAAFTTLAVPLQANLLQLANNRKLISLGSPEYTKTLDELYQDQTGQGAYVYFLFSKDRGDLFLSRLKEYIIKFQENEVLIAGVKIATCQDLKGIDIMSLPVSDKLKSDLLKVANPSSQRPRVK